MVFNATVNNISVNIVAAVLLMEETGVPGEKLPTCRKSLTNFIIVPYRIHLAWVGFELTNLVVIRTDSIGSHNSNYHTITTTMAP
jgi:hypothetical protein